MRALTVSLGFRVQVCKATPLCFCRAGLRAARQRAKASAVAAALFCVTPQHSVLLVLVRLCDQGPDFMIPILRSMKLTQVLRISFPPWLLQSCCGVALPTRSTLASPHVYNYVAIVILQNHVAGTAYCFKPFHPAVSRSGKRGYQSTLRDDSLRMQLSRCQNHTGFKWRQLVH